jgi:hypothetical protein
VASLYDTSRLNQRNDCIVSQLDIYWLLWPKPTLYVNQLHSDFAKLKITKDLLDWNSHNDPQHPKCRVAIVRYPETYPEDYAADLKEILDTVEWKYTPDHIVVDGTLPKGITIRGNRAEDPSNRCAEELNSRIRVYGQSRGGGSISNQDPEWPAPSDLPDFLKHCPSGLGCVEADFGNEDTQ